MTASGLAVGTPVYIAPEVYRGQKATAAADVFLTRCGSLSTSDWQPTHRYARG